MKKKLLSMLLALCMVFALLPAAAMADETQELPKLDNPTNLHWDAEFPGRACWTIEGTFQYETSFKIYQKNVAEPVFQTTIHESLTYTNKDFMNSLFAYYCAGTVKDWDSGAYYFTVQSLGDGKEYTDSDEISSLDTADNVGVYSYTKPQTALAIPSKAGTWNWPASEWDADDDKIFYGIEYCFSETEVDPNNSQAIIRAIGETHSIKPGHTDTWLQDKLIGDNGTGWYYFRVRPLSNNIEEIRNGGFSPWSEGYNLAEASEGIKDALDKMADSDPGDIVTGVKALNRTELANAMQADLENGQNGTISALETLENKLGSAGVTVDEELESKFTEDDISIVGAVFNRTDDTKDISLNVGRASKDHVPGEMYNSTVAVNFSMELTEGEKPITGTLDVPVKITLPIPNSINPSSLRILHYHTDGSYEEVHTHCYKDENQWYVSFVLNSFSDFVMTQLAEGETVDYVTFDPNGGTVTPTTGALDENGKLSSLPTPTRSGYNFDGWFTAKTGGELVGPTTILTGGDTIYAHWTIQSSGGPTGGGSISTGNAITAPASTANGKVSISSATAKQGDTVTVTVTPDSGYVLDTLTVTDAAGKAVTVTKTADGKYNFTMPATAVKVDAAFKKAAALPFTDVANGAWYYDAVAYVHGKGLMNGTADTLFSPDMTTTRGMVVTLLYRLEGQPAAPAPGFTDVPDGQWYSKAIAWATVNKIVNGYGDGTFGPDDTMTREQLAAVLYRYAGYKGYDVSAKAGLAEFKDASNVSAYAKDAISWAVAKGLVNGVSADTLAPQGSASRAQLATILMRFCETVAK